MYQAKIQTTQILLMQKFVRKNKLFLQKSKISFCPFDSTIPLTTIQTKLFPREKSSNHKELYNNQSVLQISVSQLKVRPVFSYSKRSPCFFDQSLTIQLFKVDESYANDSNKIGHDPLPGCNPLVKKRCSRYRQQRGVKANFVVVFCCICPAIKSSYLA